MIKIIACIYLHYIRLNIYNVCAVVCLIVIYETSSNRKLYEKLKQIDLYYLWFNPVQILSKLLLN